MADADYVGFGTSIGIHVGEDCTQGWHGCGVSHIQLGSVVWIVGGTDEPHADVAIGFGRCCPDGTRSAVTVSDNVYVNFGGVAT